MIMKKLFIYSSFTGSGELVSKEFESHGYELRKVVEKHKFPKSFFWSIFEGGFRAGIKAKGKLINYDNNIDDYDDIVIGSPIWNATFPPVSNSILKQTNFTNKKITFVLYSGSGEAKKAVKRIKKEFVEVKIIILKEPKKYPEELEKLKELF